MVVEVGAAGIAAAAAAAEETAGGGTTEGTPEGTTEALEAGFTGVNLPAALRRLSPLPPISQTHKQTSNPFKEEKITYLRALVTLKAGAPAEAPFGLTVAGWGGTGATPLRVSSRVTAPARGLGTAGAEAEAEAGTDAGTEAGTDAGTGAGTDAGMEAGTEAGTEGAGAAAALRRGPITRLALPARGIFAGGERVGQNEFCHLVGWQVADCLLWGNRGEYVQSLASTLAATIFLS
jgi:hypothetical protein